MAYSNEALAFSQIPPSHQIRLEDRISFAYLERANVIQDRTGVVALSQIDGRNTRRSIQIPVGGISVLSLGPGTTISHYAITSCTRAGATVVFSGAGGAVSYSHATPLTSSAKWAIAQARLVSNERHQRQAALVLYKKQFGIEDMPGGSIRQMRGLEGRTMRNRYQELARKHGVQGFRRDVKSEDAVNASLNVINSILYGCAAAACAAISVNPALGVIHRGDSRSLLFDLADLYKASTALPVAFAAAQKENAVEAARGQLRAAIHKERMLEGMLGALMEILTPHLPSRDDDRLIDDAGEEVEGHRQYGTSDGNE